MSNVPTLNIGIEEEYQVIDPETRNLRSFITRSVDREQPVVRQFDQDRPLESALSASMIDMATPVCVDVVEARAALTRQRRLVCDAAKEQGLQIAAAGTHPFASWQNPLLPRHGRFHGLVEDLQVVAQRMLIFGMHVHIGVEDRDLAIDCLNVVRYMLPHLLILSTSSPFWHGRNTGLKSYRAILWDNLPRSGIPHQFASYTEYKQYVDLLLRTNCISGEHQIWWDARPHCLYPTLEFRLFDMCPSLDDALGIVAMVQALIAWLVDLKSKNISFRRYPRSLIHENKWRAERYGLDGMLIDFGQEDQVPARQLLREMLRLIDPYVDKLNSRQEINHVYSMIEHGTSADRQLALYEAHGGDENSQEALRAVVDALVQETMIE
ncbi:MAG: carboxylate-amine ligase [Chloroflexota bacterium]|nr:carboxylate-amine ligase [Chloroflexota bacterium]